MIEYYLEKENAECYEKLCDVRDQITNRNTNCVIMIKSNGFYANNAQLSPKEIYIDENDK